MKAWIWIVGIVVVVFLGVAIFWDGDDTSGSSRFEDLQKEAEKSVEEKMKNAGKELTREDNIETKLSEHQAKACEEKDGKWCTSVSYGTGWSEDCMSSEESCQQHRASVLQAESICDTIETDWKKKNCIDDVKAAKELHKEG